MGYAQLLAALREEIEREARRIRGEAAAQAERELCAAREAIETERGRALQATLAELDGERARRVAGARRAHRRELLGRSRALLEDFAREMRESLPPRCDPALFVRLLEEVLSEAGEGRLELVVEAGGAQRCRQLLADRAGGWQERAAVRERDDGVAGLQGRSGEGLLLDDTLPARLARAWARLEPEIARALFGGARASM